MAVYLDCNATTPMEPEAVDAVLKYMRDDYGNAGSRTHEFGLRAKRAVEGARDAVAAVVDSSPEEVIFTSGATESNNLAILGLAAEGERLGRKHIVSTAIEHKAVLEPIQYLCEEKGFEVTLVRVGADGTCNVSDVVDAISDETLLVSYMHVNNETGVIQPIAEVAKALEGSGAYLHVDAAQGFGKEISGLRSKRIDLVSISAHKIYGPKGVGALVCRRRNGRRPPLSPLSFGGGQEMTLRPGTLPVPLIAGLGVAARLALRDVTARSSACRSIQQDGLRALTAIGATSNGAISKTLPTCLSVCIPWIDSEAAIVALKDLAAVSNGSACTSTSYTPSHVLIAMGLTVEAAECSLRLSWSHLTPEIPWDAIAERLLKFK